MESNMTGRFGVLVSPTFFKGITKGYQREERAKERSGEKLGERGTYGYLVCGGGTIYKWKVPSRLGEYDQGRELGALLPCGHADTVKRLCVPSLFIIQVIRPLSGHSVPIDQTRLTCKKIFSFTRPAVRKDETSCGRS